ncbi:MAG TPA: metalloregulator ArsR/SmtB family transcription factor [Acidocella sp.]|nr:metalloregulator ArsR/SmtB family transcription factor [Acidocella sp.]
MESEIAVTALAALAHAARLNIFRLLVAAGPQGQPAGQIAERLNLPANTLSFHLNQLRHAGLVAFRREGRSLIYVAEYAEMNALLAYLTENCCRGEGGCFPTFAAPNLQPREESPMPAPSYNVMFLCTGNSARSIMAESILRQDGAYHFAAFSAGSHPSGAVNPLALKVLESYGYLTDSLRSKSWDEFAPPTAPAMDFVFTVCDNAAGEVCPVWPGHPMTAHWGIDDPAAVTGTALEKEAAFVQAFKYLRTRIGVFLSLPLSSIDRLSLDARLREIGRGEGASTSFHGAS